MKRFLSVFTTLCFLVVLAGCGSSGSSSDDNSDENVTPTGDGGDNGNGSGSDGDTIKFTLGGTIEGLIADSSIRISNGLGTDNGGETRLIGVNGDFTFLNALEQGTVYSVTIEEMPAGQICVIEGGSNALTRDRDDVLISCATLSEVTVDFVKPAKLEFDELRLLSNYAGKGGLGEPPIESSSVSITAFNNSYISLRDLNGDLIYLAYVDNVVKGSFVLNADTTAAALIVLEPSIALGLVEHDKQPLELIKHMENEQAEKFNALSAEIEKRVNRGDEVLIESDDDLYASYQLALLAAAEYLNVPFVDDNGGETDGPQVPEGKIALQRTDIDVLDDNSEDNTNQDNNEDSNTENNTTDEEIEENVNTVLAYAELLGEPQSGVKVVVENLANRAIAIRQEIINGNTTFADDVIGSDIKVRSPNEPATILFTQALQDDFKLTLDIFGPGEFGEFEQTNDKAFLSAVTRSVLVQYVLPSLKTTLGLADVKNFDIEACYTGDTLDAVTDTIVTELQSSANTVLRNSLRDKEYYFAYTSISKIARNQLKATLTGGLRPLEELLRCSEFETGSFIDNDRRFAFENTVSLWDAVNRLIDTEDGEESFVKTVDLFAQRNLTRMIRDLKLTRVKQTWELTNSLDVTIDVANTTVTAGDTVEFEASCAETITKNPVDCEIEWDFGDGSSAVGDSVIHSFVNADEFTVTAKGEMASQMGESQIIITVEANPTPDVNVQFEKSDGQAETITIGRQTSNQVTNTNREFRLFVSPFVGEDFPAFSIELADYNGDGIYPLTDECAGQASFSVLEQFCTKSTGGFSSEPFTGEAIVSTVEGNIKKVQYSFEGVEASCIDPSATCETITVAGEFTFVDE